MNINLKNEPVPFAFSAKDSIDGTSWNNVKMISVWTAYE